MGFCGGYPLIMDAFPPPLLAMSLAMGNPFLSFYFSGRRSTDYLLLAQILVVGFP